MKLAEHDPQGSVGFPLGSTPDESFANMMTFLKNAAAKLDRLPPPPSFEPANLRNIAAFREAVIIEQEVRKGAAGNSTVVARADLLRPRCLGSLARWPGVWPHQHAAQRGDRQACRRR